MADASLDLDAALAAAAFPHWTAFRVEAVSPLARLYASRWVHRLVPTRLAIPAAILAGRARWHTDARLRRRSRQWAAAILDGSDPGAVTRLARLVCVEQTVKDVVIWRPWALRRAELRGLRHLRSAQAAGRGVLVVTAHTQLVNQVSLSLLAHGIRLNSAAARIVRAPTGYRGLVAVGKRRNGQESGIRYLMPGRAYSLFRELLRRGEACLLTFDRPGSRETRIGGRTVHLARGSAELAFETGAPIVPIVGVREGTRLVCHVRPVMESAGYRDTSELHQHLASVLAQTLHPYVAQMFPRKLDKLLWAGSASHPQSDPSAS
jgi:lauroyl/myristoyl acyltransferase